jgi:hypothetical protein
VPSGCFGQRYTAPERRANEAHPHRSPLLLFYPYVSGEREGERWRGAPEARICKRVPPAAIRSTEKLDDLVGDKLLHLCICWFVTAVHDSAELL